MTEEHARPRRVIGRCELFEEIDSGGIATVHLGRQTAVGGFSKIVAIKRMHDQFARDPQFVAMFLDEARLVARIKHPNVLPTLDLIEQDGELFIVMDYLPGVSLAQLSIELDHRAERIPVPITLRIVCGMLHGLHAAHEAKSRGGEALELVHRDVSPENILVCTDGVSRLLDFGMARALDRLHITQAGQVKGKLSVMAPEQVQGKEITRLTDVFASGVVLWQALTGQRLIRGEHMAEIASNVVNQVFEPPSRMATNVPKKLDSIVMRALERSPEARWPTAERMALALEAVGELASPREVGMWVQKVAWEKLAERAKVVAAIESTPLELQPVEVSPPPRLPPPRARTAAHEDSVGPVATSARHSFGKVASALMNSARRGLGGSVWRYMREQPRTTLVVMIVAAAATFALVALLSGSDDGLAVAANGLVPGRSRATPAGSSGALVPQESESESASASASASGEASRVVVPAGEFLHGCNTWADKSCAPDEMPGRKVTISAFELDRTEVTVRQYRACIKAGVCNDKHLLEEGVEGAELVAIDKCNFDREGRDDHPINCVSHDQAKAYCGWAGGRLPTEAEWAKAAAGIDSWPYPSGGSTVTCTEAVLSERGDGCMRGTTWPVGSKPKGKSPFGALDMAGNVSEWVADWYDPIYLREAPANDPPGPEEGAMHVVRGGSWRDAVLALLRTSARDKRLPGSHSIQVGFRCAYTPTAR